MTGYASIQRETQPNGPVEKPRWVKLLERIRGPADKGVGDTAQRLVARFGGERVKAFADRIGIPCGCADRQEQWNALWPY